MGGTQRSRDCLLSAAQASPVVGRVTATGRQATLGSNGRLPCSESPCTRKPREIALASPHACVPLSGAPVLLAPTVRKPSPHGKPAERCRVAAACAGPRPDASPVCQTRHLVSEEALQLQVDEVGRTAVFAACGARETLQAELQVQVGSQRIAEAAAGVAAVVVEVQYELTSPLQQW